MRWILSAIFINIVFLILAFKFCDPTHIEIGNHLLWFGYTTAIITMVGGINLFKYIFPQSFSKYKLWRDKTSSATRSFLMSPLFGIGIFFSLFLAHYNQYRTAAPIEIVNTVVIDKKIKLSSGGRPSYFTEIYIFPDTSLVINSKNIYTALNINDRVITKIQKGRLGYYFAIDLNILKNNQHFSL